MGVTRVVAMMCPVSITPSRHETTSCTLRYLTQCRCCAGAVFANGVDVAKAVAIVCIDRYVIMTSHCSLA